jgi:hypothetical protein
MLYSNTTFRLDNYYLFKFEVLEQEENEIVGKIFFAAQKPLANGALL